MSKEAMASIEADEIKNFLRIKVIQVGDEVTRCVAGDEIFIPARCLAPGRADSVEVDGVCFFIVAEQDIVGNY